MFVTNYDLRVNQTISGYPGHFVPLPSFLSPCFPHFCKQGGRENPGYPLMRYCTICLSMFIKAIQMNLKHLRFCSPGGQAQGRKNDCSDPSLKVGDFLPPEGKLEVENIFFETQKFIRSGFKLFFKFMIGREKLFCDRAYFFLNRIIDVV